MSSTSSASGLLNLNISTATGVSASTAPASRPGRGAGDPPDRRPQQRDGADGHQGLRGEHAPRREAEDPPRQRHHPQRGGRLVDGDRVGGVERAEEERRPVLRPGLHGRGVERVGPAGGGQVPEVEHRGAEQQRRRGRGVPTAAGGERPRWERVWARQDRVPTRSGWRSCRDLRGGEGDGDAVRGRNTQARKRTNRSTVAAALAATMHAPARRPGSRPGARTPSRASAPVVRPSPSPKTIRPWNWWRAAPSRPRTPKVSRRLAAVLAMR